MPESAHPVRPPRQERSRQTLERILDATERLLEDRSFEAITLSEIVSEAGTSVGAFYTRFRDKDALLPALYARFDESFETWAADRSKDIARAGRSLEAVVDAVARLMVDMFTGRPNLLRAMSIHARRYPTMIDDETRTRRFRQMTYVRDALLACRDEISHPDPERAVDLATFFGATVCREALLFGDATHAGALGVQRDEIASETARMMRCYLKGTV